MNDDIIRVTAGKLHERFAGGPYKEVPESVFVTAILDWRHVNSSHVTEETLDCPKFRSFVEEYFRRLEEAEMFTGGRWFSAEKLSAMTSYIAARGQAISKTKLNKLLFYADFIHYYLHQKSISGSRYIHMQYGPVAEYYREMLDALFVENKLQIKKKHGHEEFLANVSEALDTLSMFEVATLQWVLDNFGEMNAHGITDFSHHEKAFRFTRPGEFIPYEFAKHFESLPDPIPPDADEPILGH